MNVENIANLAAQLKVTGFEEMDSLLLKRICFKPNNFTISSTTLKGNEQMSCEIYFERDRKNNGYIFKFYDAILLKETPFLEKQLNGVDAGVLENLMKEINWKAAFELNLKKVWSAENKQSWENEAAIESVMDSFEKLETTEAGRILANSLKQKFWGTISNTSPITNFNFGKNKSGVSQRFYFFEGEAVISIDEAFRFLQNKWREKQEMLKRKKYDEIREKQDIIGEYLNVRSTELKKQKIKSKKGIIDFSKK